MPDKRVQSIVIVGGGTAGWMTAAALGKALDARQCHIRLVESDDIGTIGVGEATIPSMAGFNGFIGFDEQAFMRKTQGTFKLGIEFVDWTRLGHRYIHPFGEFGIDMESIPFHHYWLRQRSSGTALELAEYSLETLAARQGRFIQKTGITHPLLSRTAYAYHLDAGAYARALREIAEQRGVKRIEGKVKDVALHSHDGFIDAVIMESGERIAGELFIDCSGFRGLLIEQALHTGFEDWSGYLPCDSAWAVQCRGTAGLTPYTRSTARPAGWQWRIPLQHRVGNGHVFSSSYMSEDEARSILLQNLEGQPITEPRLIKFKAGRRKQLWNRNCVAIGLAGGFLEPLESTSIHMIQIGIFKLLGFFPTARFSDRQIDHYNESLRLQTERIRDFLILHYHATQREDSELWKYCRHMQVPQYLREKMELFRTSGIILRQDEELFKESSWLAVLEGQGVHAQDYHPLADTLPDRDVEARMSHIKAVLDRAVGAMPSSEEFINEYCRGEE